MRLIINTANNKVAPLRQEERIRILIRDHESSAAVSSMSRTVGNTFPKVRKGRANRVREIQTNNRMEAGG